MLDRNCQFCNDGTKATVDGSTIYGSWAYMCNECLVRYGSGMKTWLDTIPSDTHTHTGFECGAL